MSWNKYVDCPYCEAETPIEIYPGDEIWPVCRACGKKYHAIQGELIIEKCD